MHPAIEATLTVELRRAASGPEHGEESPTVETVELLDLLKQLGLVTSAEASHWVGLLERLAEDPLDRPIAPISDRQKAIEWLNGYQAASGGRGWHAWGARDALAYAGLLTGEEYERLAHPPEENRPPRSRQADLVRRIVGPDERFHGLRVLAVELYEDGLSLIWHLNPGSPLKPAAFSNGITIPDAHLVLSDDAGTPYRWQGGSGGLSPAYPTHGSPGHTEFGPAPYDSATRLRITKGEESLEIPLAPA